MQININTAALPLKAIVAAGSLSLTGCYAAVPLIGAEAAALESGENKRKFREAFDEGQFRYTKEMAESGCPKREYKLSKGILDYAEERAPYGLDAAIKQLDEIAQNPENNNEVRAEALYHKGVAQLYKGEFSKKLSAAERSGYYGKSRLTLETLQSEYPEAPDCAVQYNLDRLDSLAQ